MIDYESEPKLHIYNAADRCNIELVKREGNHFVAKCPFCDDKSGHLWLTPHDITPNNKVYYNMYTCHHCGKSGSAIDLYAEVHGCSNKEAFKELMEFSVAHNIKERINATKNFNENMLINETVDISKRDKVYSSLLEILSLKDEHRSNLLDRGLNLNTIKNNRYKSLPENPITRLRISQQLINEGLDLKGVPGFFTDSNGNWTFIYLKGFLIPVLDINGCIQGMQIRIDNADKKKYRWFSSSKEINGAKATNWIHVRWNSSSTNEKIVLTEGPLKGDISSSLTDTTFISIVGIGNYKFVPTLLKNFKNMSTLFIAIDMDYKKI